MGVGDYYISSFTSDGCCVGVVLERTSILGVSLRSLDHIREGEVTITFIDKRWG